MLWYLNPHRCISATDKRTESHPTPRFPSPPTIALNSKTRMEKGKQLILLFFPSQRAVIQVETDIRANPYCITNPGTLFFIIIIFFFLRSSPPCRESSARFSLKVTCINSKKEKKLVLTWWHQRRSACPWARGQTCAGHSRWNQRPAWRPCRSASGSRTS